MGNFGLSITSKENIFETQRSGGTAAFEPVIRYIPPSAAFLALMLSFYSLTGNPALINGTLPQLVAQENIVSITEFKELEQKITKRDYSFITARGGRSRNLVFTNTVY